MLGIAHTLAAVAVATATPAAALHIDLNGDGVRDVLNTNGSVLTIHSTSGVSTARLSGRLDGAFRVRGVAGALLLVRTSACRSGVVDALYRLHRGPLYRVHVEGLFADGLVTAVGGSAYVDVDCGADARTVVQVEEVPTGHAWRETVVSLTLRDRRLTVTSITESVVAHARSRRCAVARR